MEKDEEIKKLQEELEREREARRRAEVELQNIRELQFRFPEPRDIDITSRAAEGDPLSSEEYKQMLKELYESDTPVLRYGIADVRYTSRLDVSNDQLPSRFHFIGMIKTEVEKLDSMEEFRVKN